MFDYTTSHQCPKRTMPYVIQPWDTLSSIAPRYGTTIQAIIRVNPGINPYMLQIGQQICIPARQQEYPSCPTTNYYVIQAGDTLESIATYFNMTVEEILQTNLGIGPEDLYVNMYLCIPVAPPVVRIEVNTSTKMLILYHGDSIFKTYPVGVGRANAQTPKGTYQILYKEVTPEEKFGLRLLGLSVPNYIIHGTSHIHLIGTEATNGNIVMANEDIEQFFNLVPVETIIKIF